MALPKLKTNEYTLTVPSTQEEVKFRPFLVREQKILMIAEESSDEKQIASSMARLVSDCTFQSVDAATSPMFDIEYIFLQIRSKSVGEQVELEVTCPDDNETRVKVEINLSEINIQLSLEHSKSIKLTDDIALNFRYPMMKDFENSDNAAGDFEQTMQMIYSCIESVQSGEELIQRIDMTYDEIVEFIDEVDDLGPYYEAADLLFLSSRTDPLPNVAIDAMLKGVPIACFENASGFSDILATHDETRHLVAPYASVSGAAKVIARAMDDQSNACEVSTFLKQQAAELFDLKTYVEKIDSYGNEAAAHLEQMHQNADNILDTGLFNKEFHFGDVGRSMEETQAVKEYLNNIRMNWPLARHNTGTFIRRPVVGFNPLIYNFENPVQPGVFLDPLSDFLSKGRPAGPWLHRVFGPTKELAPSKLKTAIHGHFHYPDLLGDFLRSLGVNQTRPDLFITTTSGEKMAEINVELERTGWHAKDVWVVPNLGRDIYPFIKELPQRLAAHYDIVGHIHGKKSKHVDAQIGDRWRNFAWQHILGDQNPMVDLISAAFSNNSDIGLIFPEDPHLNGWDRNEKIATEMAGRMGLATPLPIHFDFPVGTMFWARPEALKPLFEMELDSSEIPVEPVAEDGTILHAFERLIPFVVAKTGFNYATTHVAGVNR